VNGGVIGKDGGGAISLMDITIEDERGTDARFKLHGACGDGDIIKDAVSAAAFGEGMMSAAGEIDGDAILEGAARRRDGGSCGASAAFDHLERPGEADPPKFITGELSIEDALDPVGGMYESELFDFGGWRHHDIVLRESTAGLEAFAEQSVAGHGKLVPGREWEDEEVGVVEFHSGIIAKEGTSVPCGYSAQESRCACGEFREQMFAFFDGRELW
jgi:hypothetical protein